MSAASPSSKNLPIVVRGAREHNLRSVDLVLERNQFICFTGVSGSGKSSLAFDTLYAEGQRRYLESLSTYARQFVGQLPKPDVDLLSGLSPSISISQKSTGNNPRSTVGTITELTDFLRVLFARCGTGFCPRCDGEIASQTRDQMIERVMGLPSDRTYLFLAPVVRGQKGEHKDLFEEWRRAGFNRARADGNIFLLSDPPNLERYNKHDIELIVDRIPVSLANRPRIAEAIDNALRFGDGTMLVSPLISRSFPQPDGEANPDQSVPKTKRSRKKTASASPTSPPSDSIPEVPGKTDPVDLISDPALDVIFSQSYACPKCGISYPPPTPQLLSFNSPQGACPTCEGLGETYAFSEDLLIPDPSKSIRAGAIELLGKWTDMPKWLRKSLGTLSKLLSVRAATESKKDLISLAWQSLDKEQRRSLLFGAGSIEIPCQRIGSRTGIFTGIVNELVDIYRQFSSPMHKARYEKYMRILPCNVCQGARLNAQARSLRVKSKSSEFRKTPWMSIGDCSHLSIDRCLEFFSDLELNATQSTIAHEALKEIRQRLQFLQDVGLGYLALERTAPTLSGGESQRIRLASQIGAGLVGVLYVLDEPSIGLHPRDNEKLLASLKRLRDLGNTLIVVEHDEDTMRAADTIVDFGPGPGVRGGELISIGSIEDVANNPRSWTGRFLSRSSTIPRPETRRRGNGNSIHILGASHNNLKKIDIEFPLGKLIAVTGVSGSGKSSLVTDILTPVLRNALNKAEDTPGSFGSIQGIEHLDKIIDIDQSPIGRTPRSNPATYTKVFDEIRDLFAELPESKRRGFTPGVFSFNTEHGRCTACDGHGAIRLDMEFLADLWIPCTACEGKRYNRATLQVLFKEKSIADCLDLDVQQALEHFSAFPKIVDKLETLAHVGLEYLKLGQPSPTLSGGEAQRIKLSRELSKRATGRTLYVLDEPTTGLHFHDIDLLLRVLQNLVDRGNTVVVVEHNLDLIQAADWVIDLGPEGGAAGGEIVCCGSPEQVAKKTQSHTGQALRKYFATHATPSKSTSTTKETTKSKKSKRKADSPATSPALEDIRVTGAKQHNLKNIDMTIPRHTMTVFCGHSGSGKTSMAMDTIYAEGQRRFVESLSPYVRQFVGQMPKPNVDRIDGLSPSIAIEQRGLSHTPRSTVGTVTEIYDYLRVIFARLAQMHCTQCDAPVSSQTADQILDRWFALAAAMREDTRDKKRSATRCLLLAPVAPNPNQTPSDFFDELKRQGFARVRINGRTVELDAAPNISHKTRNEYAVVVDRLQFDSMDRKRLTDSLATALHLSSGIVQMAIVDDGKAENLWNVHTFSLQLACNQCGISFQSLTPHHFSFNTAVGWCPTCEGLGIQSGTDPASFINADLSLAEGGLLIWPDPNLPLSQAMLRALARSTGIDIHLPIHQWTWSQRSVLLRGLPNQEISVFQSDWPETPPPDGKKTKHPVDSDRAVMTYRFHGVYPTLELLSNANPAVRMRLSRFLADMPCTACDASRVRPEASHARFRQLRIGDLVRMPIGELAQHISNWSLSQSETKIAGELLREMSQRMQFLIDVGLDYLTLDRAANTLSGGESQRIRLASQLGSGLCGVLYVLDEPTIGLHPRDNHRLITAMHRLRDLGNTLLVVEHDRDVIASSDEIRDFGPGAGPYGGQVVSQGNVRSVTSDPHSITGPYLSGKRGIEIASRRSWAFGNNQSPWTRDWTEHVMDDLSWLTVRGAQANTLKGIDVAFPLGRLTAVTGPSGSGKSSLVNSILYPSLARRLHRADLHPGLHDTIEGIANINKVLRVDQSPLGNSPTSNPATYTGVFDAIRQFFAKLPEAKLRGFSPSDFSFNVGSGRCEKCDGVGHICVQMHFLPDVWIACDSCHGRRYTEAILAVKYRGHSISDVLAMSIGQVRDLMSEIPKIHQTLSVLCDVGLDYVALGQSAPTLSGGEAQRVKLAAELCRPATGRTLYLLDEPTTGLHFDDINKLMNVLDRLVSAGNTVVIIEHNLEVIRVADWIIDLGPEAGEQGGQLVFAGPPEKLVAFADAHSRLRETGVPPIASGRRRSSARSAEFIGQTPGAELVHETSATPFSTSSAAATSLNPSNMPRSHTGEALHQWESQRTKSAPSRTRTKPKK
ncbi:MAG: excinuclease ABC subunit UvrA [Planctomycetota bacterium]